MDYYRVLGLNRSATKEEIKEAFRNLALQFHPDKHSASPKSVRDAATLRFKQVSEAYDVLNNDRKRAEYNLRYNSGTGYTGYGRRHNSNYYNSSSYSSSSSSSGNYGYGYAYSKASAKANGEGSGLVSGFEIGLRFLTTRAFLLNLAFAGAILGGMFVIDTSGEALWKMHNPGKSFEEAMESIEKNKAAKEEA